MADLLTIAQMRQVMGSSPDASDEDVQAAYDAFTNASVLPLEVGVVVELDEIKRHLRVDGDDEDDEIVIYRDAAVGVIEAFTGLSLTRRLLTWNNARFDRIGRLPRRPVRAVLEVQIIDRSGAAVLLPASSWRLSTDGLIPATSSGWPATASVADAVSVAYEAGYDDEMALPAQLKVAVLMLTAQFYRFRDVADEPTGAVAAMCRPYRRPVMA